MEGKAVLFKKFADIDGIDLELETTDPNAFVQAVSLLAPTFGGINLEDIIAPECFENEKKLRDMLDIPVFHDDQHGTAIIVAAGFVNAIYLTKRDISKTKIVCNGAGAASIACAELLKTMGVPDNNIILCDRTGPIFRGRDESMNPWKLAHAAETNARTLDQAIENGCVSWPLIWWSADKKDG